MSGDVCPDKFGLLCLVGSDSNVAAPVQCQKWGRKKNYSSLSRQWLIESFCIWSHAKIALPLLRLYWPGTGSQRVWTIRVLNPGGGEIFRARPYRDVALVTDNPPSSAELWYG